MISLRYRSNIIGYDLRSVQYSYTLSTVLESYLLFVPETPRQHTGVKSYFVRLAVDAGYSELSQVTVAKSYFEILIEGTTIAPGVLIIIIVLGLVKSTSDISPAQRTFDEIAENSPDETRSEETESTDNEGQTKQSEILAYGYARQSQTDESDDKESHSIRTQKKNIYETASEYGYEIGEIFVDKNESGFSFDREGFKQLEEQLEKNPAPVFLDRINRLGREALETIHISAHIHYQHEVPIITAMHGDYDLDSSNDQMQLAIKAIAAGEAVNDRIRASWDSIYERFEDDRNWLTWFDKIPVGYEIPDDETWLRPHPKGSEVVSAIMEDLCKTESYVDTIELLRNASQNQTLASGNNTYALSEIDAEAIKDVFDASDYEIDDINRRMVKHGIYVGEVRYPRSADADNQALIEDEDLVLLDQDLFEEVNMVADEIKRDWTPDSEESADTTTLSDLGILLQSVEVIDNFGPVCPDCNKGMVKNGRTTLNDGTEAHYWICPKYKDENKDADCQRKVPYEEEWEALQEHVETEYSESDVVLLEVCRFG